MITLEPPGSLCATCKYAKCTPPTPPYLEIKSQVEERARNGAQASQRKDVRR